MKFHPKQICPKPPSQISQVRKLISLCIKIIFTAINNEAHHTLRPEENYQLAEDSMREQCQYCLLYTSDAADE